MSRDKNRYLRLAGQPADYQKLGIDPVLYQGMLVDRVITRDLRGGGRLTS
jgi:hypothetical protein